MVDADQQNVEIVLTRLRAPIFARITSYLTMPELSILQQCSSDLRASVRNSPEWRANQPLGAGDNDSSLLSSLREAQDLYEVRSTADFRATGASLRSRTHRSRENRSKACCRFVSLAVLLCCFSSVLAFLIMVPLRLDDSSYRSWDGVFVPLWIGLGIVLAEPWIILMQCTILRGLCPRHGLWASITAAIVHRLPGDTPLRFWWVYAQYCLFCLWPLLAWLHITGRSVLSWSTVPIPAYISVAMSLMIVRWRNEQEKASPTEREPGNYCQGVLDPFETYAFVLSGIAVMLISMVPIGLKADGADMTAVASLSGYLVSLSLIQVAATIVIIILFKCGSGLCASLGSLLVLGVLLLSPLFGALRVDSTLDWEWKYICIPAQIAVIIVMLIIYIRWDGSVNQIEAGWGFAEHSESAQPAASAERVWHDIAAVCRQRRHG